MKKNQLLSTGDQDKLKQIVGTVNRWRVAQLLLIPFIAKLLNQMTFRKRIVSLVGLTTFIVIHESHLDGIRDLANS